MSRRDQTPSDTDARHPSWTEATEAAVPGPEAPSVQPEGAQAQAEQLESLQKELEAARKRINELAYAVQAGAKEREEFKQRIQRERERLMDLERAEVATALLETMDELELCLKAASPSDPLAQGVKMIRDGIVSRLAQKGVERLDVVGKRFNPNEHEAADMEITGEPDDDQKIVAELRAGFRLKDKVIRPARVKVLKYVTPANA